MAQALAAFVEDKAGKKETRGWRCVCVGGGIFARRPLVTTARRAVNKVKSPQAHGMKATGYTLSHGTSTMHSRASSLRVVYFSLLSLLPYEKHSQP